MKRSSKVVAVVAGVVAFGSLASADERKFNYSYEAKTLPKGTWEFEQWATLKMEKESGDYRRMLLREEFEVGLTDRLTTSFYLNTVYQATRDVPGMVNEHDYGFQSVSNEWKYKLTDPSLDLVGFLLYGELLASNDEYEIEAKLVFSKHVGPFTLAYNFVYEWELEREVGASPEWTWAHIVENTAGVSLDLPFLPAVAVGGEARSEMHFERSLSGPHNHAYYAGPNLHVSLGSWWATLSYLKQIRVNHLEFSEDDNTRGEVRLIVGVTF